MEPARTQAAWRTLDTLLTVGTLGSTTDGQLLDCFQGNRDAAGQEAFRILVDRHGPMVLGLCRSLIRDPHEAEDAFQATFLILVRKAESIRKRETIGPWLYGVACRVARRARNRSNRRQKREVPVIAEIAIPDDPAAERQGTESVVQEEIARLPESCRAPIVLCCIQGLSYDLAARRLGVSEPTLRGRLHRARKRLASRLRRRGILAPVIARAIIEPGLPLPAIPSSLVESTVQFASRWSAVRGLLVGATAVPESIAALAQGVIQAMLFQTIKLSGIAAILTLGVVGTVVLAQQGKNKATNTVARSAEAPVASPQNKPAPAADPQQPPSPRDLERLTRQILEKLDEPIAMSFGNETPLGDVLKYIKQATTTPTFTGIPIYVDPFGLPDGERSLRATIQLDAQGMPLKTSLRLILRQLGLDYIVKDGWLIIDSRAGITESKVEEIDRKLDQVLETLKRMERAK